MTSALIGWIVSIVFILILVGGFFVGFWRGFKRSTANLIFSVIGVIIAFFITPVITNAVLGIQVNYENTQVALKDLAYEMFITMGDMKQMISTNPNLKALVANLPAALFSTLIFIVVTILVEMVIYLIYKICNFAFIKGPKGGKLFGGIVGVAKTFIVTIIAFMPFAGLIGFANNIVAPNDYAITTSAAATTTEDEEASTPVVYNLAADKLPEQALIIINGLENNMLVKCSSLFGLDNAMFDYYSGVAVEGGRVHIRKEIENIYDVADFGYQLSKYNMADVDFTGVNYDKLLESVKAITDSDLFKHVLSKTVYDVIVDRDSYSFVPTDSVVEDVLAELSTKLATVDSVSTYFSSDIETVVKTVKVLGQNGIINDILDLEDKNMENIADVLTNDDNVEHFETAINNVFALNTVKDSISSVMQAVASKIAEDVDEVSINTADISENGWKEIATSITNIVKDYAEVSKIVNIGEVLEDPAVLLDKSKHYDLSSLTQKVGDIIDQVRANRLLQTSDNKSVVDKLLENNKLTLPTGKLTAIDGKQVTVTNYKELMKFIAPSLTKVRNEGIYDLLNDDNKTSAQKVVALGAILAKEDNDTLLSDIVMPLYQVEFTRDIIVDGLANQLDNTVADFNALKNYDDWKSEIALLSDLIITLNNSEVGESTLLEFAANSEYDRLIANLTPEAVEAIVTPILTGKATQPLRESLFDGLNTEVNKLTNATTTITLDGVSFTGEESQVQEVIDIIKAFVEVNNAIAEGGNIADADHAKVAELFEAMKLNAYRTLKLEDKEEEGLIKDVFEKLVDAYKETYADAVNYIEEDEELCEQLGVSSLDSDNYVKIDFADLIEMIDTVNEALQA